MKWPAFILFCLVALLPCAAEDSVTVYDSAQDPNVKDSGVNIQFHQRVEGEEQPPLLAPEYKLMAQPCMGWHFQAGITLYNADAGRELLLLTSAAESGGAVLALVALEDKASVSYAVPDTAGAWALAPMRGDRVAIGTYYDGAVHIYSLSENKFVETVDIPGEAYVWNLVEGKDGRLYGGTFPGGKLVALDQDTLALEDCGQAGPPNRFLHEVSPLPDGRLLCRVGSEAPGLRIYDPASKHFSDAPPALDGVTGGVCWDSYFVTEKNMYDATLQPVSPPPFPVPDASGGDWSFVSALTTQNMLYLQQGKTLYRYRAGEPALTPVHSIDLRGGRMLASTVDGGVAGVRGQQYFRIRPGDTEWARGELSVAPPVRVPAFLRVDAQGQVWGGPAWGQTLFFMDGQTGVFTLLSSVTPRVGGVQDVAFVKGVAWGISSPGGNIFRLNIEEPWYEWDGKNPRMVASLHEKGYGQATGGIVVSAVPKLYSGWSALSGGGAIAVTDPATGKTDLMENPLGTRGISGLALNDEFLFAAAGPAAGVASPEKGAPPLFAVLGLDTLQPYWSRVYEGASAVNRLLYDDLSGRVAMAVDGVLRVFDVQGMSLQEPFESAPPEITSTGMAGRNDGYVYYGSGKKLILAHLVSGAWEEVLELPGEPGALAAGPDGGLFVACGIDIYRVDFPNPYPEINTKSEE